jgi:4'-phosphopantetheinyl transferase
MIALAETWAAANVLPRLGGGDVHVWLADLDDVGSESARVTSVLSTEETARAGRFWFEHDRRHYSRCRGILRHLLGAYLGAEPRSLVFAAAEEGKPFLPQTPIAFNVSHSGAYALIAVTRRGELGVDIEARRPLMDRDALARQCFSAVERARLQSLPEPVRAEAFFTCWTRKEAYVKAVGDGLAYPLDAFDVTFAPGDPARLSVPEDPRRPKRWTLEALDAPPGYAAALVTEGPRQVACFGWTAPYAQETV